jgi:sulfur-carrier protein
MPVRITPRPATLRRVCIVRLRGPLKQLAGGEADHPIHGATVVEVLRELERSHPALDGWILDERGRIRRHINIFVNGEQETEELQVSDADRIDVLPAISGG